MEARDPVLNIRQYRAFTAGVAVAWLSALPVSAQELNSRIESALANFKLASAKVGVCVLDLETGRTLADLRADEPLIPASNMKLITSGAALLTLGKDFVFRTEFLVDGDRLIIRGSGDPALADTWVLERSPEKLSVDGLVQTLAGAVAKAGVTQIREVVVDDRIFDRQYVHPTWPQGQLDKWYCAEVAGVNFHTNVLSVFPIPSRQGPGQPPAYSLEPSAPWLEIENKARTINSSKNSVWVGRDPGTSKLTLFGEVGIPTRVPIEITIRDVPTFAGQLFAGALPGAGVGVGTIPAAERMTRDQMAEAIKSVRLAGPGEKLEGRVVAVVTTPIEEALERCNGDSQNLYAECFIKRLGHEVTGEPGSWTNGSSVIRMKLAEPPPKGLGPAAAASTQIADGSGMSREDRVAPRTLVRWLDRLQGDPVVGSTFVTSLASPLYKESLRRRFKDQKLKCDLRGKTGTIDGVRCLSGYLTDEATGRRLAFSVMVNDVKEGEQALQALNFHEEVVKIADAWLASHRPSRPAATVPQLGGDR